VLNQRDTKADSGPSAACRRGGFQTTDFYLACFLRATGYELADLRRDGRRSVFVFQDRPERRSDVMAFYNGERSVCPLAFVDAIKNMKALIHNC